MDGFGVVVMREHRAGFDEVFAVVDLEGGFALNLAIAAWCAVECDHGSEKGALFWALARAQSVGELFDGGEVLLMEFDSVEDVGRSAGKGRPGRCDAEFRLTPRGL